jgi:MFS family permease
MTIDKNNSEYNSSRDQKNATAGRGVADLSPANLSPVTKPWYRELTSYHWFVFIMAAMSWILDCMDQQIFILARNDALKSLLPKDTTTDIVKDYGGMATSIFMIGWATGGMIFGSIGDRIGRAKTLTLTVLLYSLCTGLSNRLHDLSFYHGIGCWWSFWFSGRLGG